MWYPEIFLLGRAMKQSAMALTSLITGTTLPSLAALTMASFVGKVIRSSATLLHLAPPGSAIRMPFSVRPYGRQVPGFQGPLE